MATKLDCLIVKIHPENNYYLAEKRAYQAMECYKHKYKSDCDHDGFIDFMAAFYLYMCNEVKMKHYMDNLDDARRAVCRILVELYGVSGPATAYKLVKNQENGGYFNLMKEIAKSRAEEAAYHQIKNEVYSYYNSLSVDEQMEAEKEYLEKYSEFMPVHKRNHIHPPHFPKILLQHPSLYINMGKLTG